MESVEVTITGKSALLMHSFPMAPIEALEKKPPKEQAELALYRDTQGDPFIPGANIQRALVSAATYSKGKGRGSLQRVAAAAMFVSPEHVMLDGAAWSIDARPVVVPATKGRVLRYRPRFDAWTVSFTLEWDERLITEAQARRIVDDAGDRVGLLDFRPEKRGPFGRFMVTQWAKAKA